MLRGAPHRRAQEVVAMKGRSREVGSRRERRSSMIRKTMFAIVGLVALGVGLMGSAMATPVISATAETARGPLVDRPLDVNWHFAPETKVKLQTQGAIEIAAQRIVIAPGGTLGWHSHPGPTVVTILRGTMSFYHAEDCTEEIEYGPGASFSNLPNEIHLARNEGSEELVVFASLFVPAQTPPVALRIDQPSPGLGCPQ
jgi:quercetin dioxygenase-like cupin family protein